MISTHDRYILVLDPEQQEIRTIHSLEAALQYPVFVASSMEQAVHRLRQGEPSLVILVGNNVHAWSQPLLQHLRQTSYAADMTIVALTDSASPQWCHREDAPELDGFLVKPLSLDIVRSLIESAHARRIWHGVTHSRSPMQA